MERLIYVCFWVLDLVFQASGNSEGDALNALKTNLADPNNVFQNWDPTDTNPCRWNNITCNADNSVTRIDLGNANLSGQLVPELGQLANLQYLELYSNNISGIIPDEIGNLTDLLSLDLYLNALTGHIPTTMGNLKKLRFLRLNNNVLTDQGKHWFLIIVAILIGRGNLRRCRSHCDLNIVGKHRHELLVIETIKHIGVRHHGIAIIIGRVPTIFNQ